MISTFKKFLDLLIVICIISGSAITGGTNDNDMKIISDNIVNGLLSGEFSPFQSSDVNDAGAMISLIEYDKDGNCYFSDVDYSSTDRANWLTKRHLNRTEKLAILYRREKDETKRAEYRDYVLKLLDHWIAKDYQNSNWWYNKLATPNTLGETALLMKDDLSQKQLMLIGELIGRGTFTVNYQTRDYTGANTIDLAMSTIKFGALTGSRSTIKKAVELVGHELEYSKGEGLRADGTFFQHGNRLYMGGYGVSFINGMADLVYMLSGTKYNFTEKQLSKLSGFIVDGLSVMSFGNILDPTTMGRSVSRYNAQPLRGITKSLRKLASVKEMPRKEEILGYAENIEGNNKQNTGVHYFGEAKFVVINNEDFYFSFRGGSDDLVYSEIINDENVLGYNSSFPGVTTIMHTGGEYTNISPVYDFSMVPGTTAVYETDEKLYAHEDFTYRKLKGIYGDKAEDDVVVSFAQTEHEGIKMTVACFAINDAAFLLGAGFSDSKGRPMTTTIDQSFLNGQYFAEGNMAIHNGIKYILIDGGVLSAKSEHRTGNWRRNNSSYSDDSVERDVFTVSFENTGSYAYSIMSENTDKSIVVIKNTESLQAVRLPDGRVAAVFYEDGNFEYGGITFTGKAGEANIYDK